jgi:hypothetical protein
MDCQKIIMYGLLLLAAVYVLRDMFDMKFKIPLIEGQAVAAAATADDDETVGLPPVFEGFEGDDDETDEFYKRFNEAYRNLEGFDGDDSAAAPGGAVASPPDTAAPSPPATAPSPPATAPSPPPTEQLPSVNQQVDRTGPVASEADNNETFLPVEGIRSAPSSCYPQNTLTPKDLLPQGKEEEIEQWDENNPAQEGILKGVNFLDAGFHVGVNTVGQSLRNANLNLRAEPPNPRVQVSPWMNTTINEDLTRRPLGTEGVCNQAPPEYGLVE